VKKSRAPILITAIAVVVALIAGGGVYFCAHKSSQGSGGADSPQQAASEMLLSLSNKDPLGVLDKLDPAEAALASDYNKEVTTALQRLQILSPSTAIQSGSKITVTGLTLGPTTDKINDHVTVVNVTGGSVTVITDVSQLPLTSKISTALGSKLTKLNRTKTFQIADEVAKIGHPIRIATVNRDGKWYTSLFYTAADAWAQQLKTGNPTAADAIAAQGGSSPEDAMNQLLTAATSADYAKIIALLPPQEMAAVHDYGKLLLAKIPASGIGGGTPATLSDVKFSDATWNVSDVPGGKLVSLKTLTITTGSRKITVVRDKDAGSLTVTLPDQPSIVFTKDTVGKYIAKALPARLFGGAASSSSDDETSGSSSSVPPQVLSIIGNEFEQLIGVGVVMTPANGQWFVSPVRSYSELTVSVLNGLQPSDIDYFLSLAKK